MKRVVTKQVTGGGEKACIIKVPIKVFLFILQIHFVPMSPSQQLLTQEQLEAAARSAVTGRCHV